MIRFTSKMMPEIKLGAVGAVQTSGDTLPSLLFAIIFFKFY